MFKKKLFDLYKGLGLSSDEVSAELSMIFDYLNIGAIREITDGFSSDEEKIITEIVEKRVKTGMPLQYITGFGYFMGEKFFVNEYTLIPRPETEILVRACADVISDKSSVLDIGTGSGCIAIGISMLTGAKVEGVDISKEALKIAQKNSEYHKTNCTFYYSDLYSNIKGKYDLIVSNPPYIPVKDINSIENNVKNFEPHAALFTKDEFGVEFYEKIIDKSVTFLNKNGRLCFEAGINQSDRIIKILKNKGFSDIEIKKDFSGIERVIISKYF